MSHPKSPRTSKRNGVGNDIVGNREKAVRIMIIRMVASSVIVLATIICVVLLLALSPLGEAGVLARAAVPAVLVLISFFVSRRTGDWIERRMAGGGGSSGRLGTGEGGRSE